MTQEFYEYLFEMRASGFTHSRNSEAITMMYKEMNGSSNDAFHLYIESGRVQNTSITGEVGYSSDEVIPNLRNMVACIATAQTLISADYHVSREIAASLCDFYIYKAGKLTTPAEFETLITEMFAEYRILYKQGEDLQTKDWGVPVTPAVEYIEQHLYDRITVGDVANEIGYSESHLNKCFREKLGYSAYQFILKAKIEESRMALLLTRQPITVIASALGFSSISHFSKAFKAKIGQTPQAYRLAGKY